MLKVEYTYGGVAKFTNDFTVEVKCPALTVATITTPFTRDLANSANVETLQATGYVSGTSTNMPACALTYEIVKSSDDTALGGTWLTTDVTGNVKVNRQVLGTESVKVKYTQAGTSLTTDPFVVTV